MPYVIQYDVPGNAQVYARVKAAIGEREPGRFAGAPGCEFSDRGAASHRGVGQR